MRTVKCPQCGLHRSIVSRLRDGDTDEPYYLLNRCLHTVPVSEAEGFIIEEVI